MVLFFAVKAFAIEVSQNEDASQALSNESLELSSKQLESIIKSIKDTKNSEESV